MRWVALVVAFACSKPADRAPPHEDRHDPPVAASRLRLDVAIGGTTATWTDAAFDATPKLPGTASDGEARDTWSLRELVHKNVGPTARVTKIIGAGGATPLDATAWDDAFERSFKSVGGSGQIGSSPSCTPLACRILFRSN